jgi:hypothetical protein
MATPKKTTSITLEMAVGDAIFLKIAKMAHQNNLTFNEQINQIVQEAVLQYGKSTPETLQIVSSDSPSERRYYGLPSAPLHKS